METVRREQMSEARVGEVVEASTAGFTAEAYALEATPPFGSFAAVSDGERRIIGTVCHAETGPLDAGRRLVARGQGLATRDEIFEQHPELAHLLRTLFVVRVLGYVERDLVQHRLPPRPAPLHEAVWTCDARGVAAFTATFDFLAALLAAPQEASPEDLTAATVRHAAQAHDDPRGYLVAAGRELVRLLGGDPPRLATVLARMRP